MDVSLDVCDSAFLFFGRWAEGGQVDGEASDGQAPRRRRRDDGAVWRRLGARMIGKGAWARSHSRRCGLLTDVGATCWLDGVIIELRGVLSGMYERYMLGP
ncbi:hypothetical protein PLESTB_001451000 [Pleodorina starrii]|uniref:Uncharacterized protein n=1 Tax=Pleodorina starrii TaxID=330485 RepID=A0A9W6BWM3_9CHLO|nr:hypothetical protein PLESTM_000774400 [Pleodorina starrii]GLC59125.1 hypothetical protein PLESTB_001451000 [Pleodorina starrii]GLC64976.1 hypothetical protein PLESTF_000232000 [Pleodorina starrii]